MQRVAKKVKRLLNTTNLTRQQIAERVGCGKSVVSYHATKMGLPVRVQRPPQKILDATCQNCSQQFKPRRSSKGLFCSHYCAAQQRKIPIEQLVKTASVRQRLLDTRPYQCAACRRKTWCGAPIPLEVDHIDGHSDNNAATNVRLICPNCHALTPTYKARNKGRGRWTRRQRYRDGKSY